MIDDIVKEKAMDPIFRNSIGRHYNSHLELYLYHTQTNGLLIKSKDRLVWMQYAVQEQAETLSVNFGKTNFMWENFYEAMTFTGKISSKNAIRYRQILDDNQIFRDNYFGKILMRYVKDLGYIDTRKEFFIRFKRDDIPLAKSKDIPFFLKEAFFRRIDRHYKKIAELKKQ